MNERTLPEPGNVSRNTTWTLRGLDSGTYAWTVRAVDNAFNGGPMAEGTFSVGTAAVNPNSAPKAFGLSTAYPNPFHLVTRFTLFLEIEQPVTVAVFDAQGRRVASLKEGPLEAGAHTFSFDGAPLASGDYFVKATGSRETAVRRVTLVK
jgi:hypothetical protein